MEGSGGQHLSCDFKQELGKTDPQHGRRLGGQQYSSDVGGRTVSPWYGPIFNRTRILHVLQVRKLRKLSNAEELPLQGAK